MEETIVKRMILVVAGCAALALVYFGSQLLAQGTTTGQAPAAYPGSRVAVINIGTVFSDYKKAKFFKQEMETTLKPYKDKIEGIQKTLISWDQEAKKPGSTHPKEQIDANIVQCKRAIEDEQRQARALVARKSEQQLEQLWKEINEVIGRAAKAYSFNLVLAFGDPSEVETKGLGTFANINRKLQAIEMGSISPLYFDSQHDLTRTVVETLNQAYDAAGAGRPAVPGQPVSSQK
jgi:Skp family chaperone for outer membrane proteins